METLGKIVLAVFFMFTSVLLKGLVVFKFWAWFLHATFGVFAIGFKEAIAVAFLISLFGSSNNRESKGDSMTQLVETWIFSLTLSLSMLFSGWIAYLLIK